MTDLTEQWKKGELPSGWYYTKLWKGCNVIDYFIGNQFLRYDDSDIVEVIALVPSYEEWQLMQDDNKRLKHDVGNLGYKIKNQRHEIDNRLKEIEKLKELLKECKPYIGYYTYEFDGKVNKLLTKIDEALR